MRLRPTETQAQRTVRRACAILVLLGGLAAGPVGASTSAEADVDAPRVEGVRVLSALLVAGRDQPERNVYTPGEQLFAVLDVDSPTRGAPLRVELTLAPTTATVSPAPRAGSVLRAEGRPRTPDGGPIELGVRLDLPSDLPSGVLGPQEATIRLFAGEDLAYEERRPIELRRRIELGPLSSSRAATAPGGIHPLRAPIVLFSADEEPRSVSVRWSLRGEDRTSGGSGRITLPPGSRQVDVDVAIPAAFPAGTYDVEVEVEDDVSGQRALQGTQLQVDMTGGTTGALPVDLAALPSYCGPGTELEARRRQALLEGVGLVQLFGIDETTLEELLSIQRRLGRQGGRPWQWVIHARSTEAPGIRFERALEGELMTVMRKNLPIPRDARADFLRAAERILGGFVPQRSTRIPFTRPTESSPP